MTSEASPSLVRAIVPDILGKPVGRVVFAAVFLGVAFLYTLMLPAAYAERLSLANWRYLDARDVAFSAAFGLLLGWIVAVQLCAMRHLAGRRRQTGTWLAVLLLLGASAAWSTGRLARSSCLGAGGCAR